MTVKAKAREVKGEDNLHYVKWTGQEEYVLANKGITNWEQALNANTEDGTQYIGESTAQGNASSYAPSVSYEGNAYPDDAFNLWVYQQGKSQIIGATFEEVEVETWNEDTSGVYHAYHRTYEVQPDNPGSGEGGGKLGMSGTFSQQGAQEEGTFNISTKTFTKSE